MDNSLTAQMDVPETVRKREPDLYELLFRCAIDGCSLEDAKSQLANSIGAKTIYAWKKDYPAWYNTILKQATGDALEVRRSCLLASYTRRENVQFEIEKDIAEVAPDLVRTLIARATDPEVSTRLLLELTNKLSQFIKDGFAFHVEALPPREEEEEAAISTLRTRLPPPPGSMGVRPGTTISFHVEADQVVDVTPKKEEMD